MINETNGMPDYPVRPLPDDLLARLPQMTRGQRIVEIRKTQGLRQIELRRKAKLSSATCATIEARDSIPTPRNLFLISSALEVDPILIVFGRTWKDISLNLTDGEKMSWLRIRKGWTQDQLSEELEKQGVIFDTDDDDAKRTTVAQWERNFAKPTPEKRPIIRKALGDDNLFCEAAPSQKSIPPKLLPYGKKSDTPAPKPAPLRRLQRAPATTPPATLHRVILMDVATQTSPSPSLNEAPRKGVIQIAAPKIILSEVGGNIQEGINRIAEEALTNTAQLGATEVIADSDVEFILWGRVVRRLIAQLKEMGAKNEAQIVETILQNEIASLRQKIAVLKEGQGKKKHKAKIPSALKTANRPLALNVQACS